MFLKIQYKTSSISKIISLPRHRAHAHTACAHMQSVNIL